jgi:hypothetical protein
MSYNNGPRIIQSGLTMCLDAGNTKSYIGSGTAWTDLTKNGNSGTLTNGPTYTSSFGGGIVFDGIDDTANITTIDLRISFTYECWVYMSVLSGFSFLGQGTTTANSGLHIWNTSDTSLRFGMYGNDTDVTSLTSSTGTWYHYTFTYNHASPYTKNIYRNGVKQTGTELQAQSQYTGTGTLRIGATYGSGGAYANGRFAMTRIYNRILSDAEILKNYNATKGRFGLS